IDELVAAAVAQTESDPELARLLARTDSMPGFAAKAAVLVIGELSVLPPMTARQWVAQAGLDVREETSGTSLARRPRLSKRGNKRLREALFYPALTAARSGLDRREHAAPIASGRNRIIPLDPQQSIFEIGGGDVVEQQRAILQVAAGQLGFDERLLAAQPVERAIDLLGGDLAEPEHLAQRMASSGGVQHPSGRQLGRWLEQARDDQRQRQIAPALRRPARQQRVERD